MSAASDGFEMHKRLGIVGISHRSHAPPQAITLWDTRRGGGIANRATVTGLLIVARVFGLISIILRVIERPARRRGQARRGPLTHAVASSGLQERAMACHGTL